MLKWEIFAAIVKLYMPYGPKMEFRPLEKVIGSQVVDPFPAPKYSLVIAFWIVSDIPVGLVIVILQLMMLSGLPPPPDSWLNKTSYQRVIDSFRGAVEPL
jgi:hypothetical protein